MKIAKASRKQFVRKICVGRGKGTALVRASKGDVGHKRFRERNRTRNPRGGEELYHTEGGKPSASTMVDEPEIKEFRSDSFLVCS